MRRTILVSLFFLGACGGGVTKPDAVDTSGGAARLERMSYLASQDGQAVVASFKGYSSDAMDTCLSAWIDGEDARSDIGGPVDKPNAAGLRAFLAQCLGSSPSGGLRADTAPSVRSNERPIELRNQDASQ